MCQVLKAKELLNTEVQYYGDYKFLKKKPAYTFVMLNPDDRQKLNKLIKKSIGNEADLEHLILTKEMIDCIMGKDYSTFAVLRKKAFAEMISECLKKLGIKIKPVQN